ncbi:MAG: hypothetical protein ABR549_20095 [Mycobacteriales bacterium]
MIIADALHTQDRHATYLHLNGHTNIAAACRYTSRHPIRAADLRT